ncbi:alpha/beta hydrolase [Flammeovirga sp. EKP202]|uniref:alpha/beta hydrolase n=1 Tax=Flammeovirga sp. EKP202 TaxID=2770592 RepID=UPI00165FBEBC|nr:alpha/beta hydrolase [Flammeovirga sp. EKP202]MBD0404515.1 alpha/beta hydrolase [Flammeovirga sp. EKP202]
MKDRLIILSDLWGKEKADWLTDYTRFLEPEFDVVFYDTCTIGQVDKSDYSQDHLHQQFLNGGIDLAVEYLVEKEQTPIDILAFSIGGAIAWKFGLKTGNIKSLTSISSTRLRKETKRPKGKIELYFGEKDEHRPSIEWMENMQLEFTILPNKSHEIYREAEFARNLSKKISKQ